jgi:hypothetical protein
MAERTPPVFAATPNATVPVPVPLAPASTVIQVTLLLALQPQPLATVTDADTSAPALGTTPWLVELIEYTHAAAGPSASCVTETLWSPTRIVPTRRSVPSCGAMRTPMLPSPLPVAGVVNDIQLASVAAVHVQPPGADTATSRVPPPAARARLFDPSSNRHAAACCDTRRRLSLTRMSPSRTAGRGLGATRNSTVPAPCPALGVRPDSQLAPVETSHGHSGDVVTVMVPAPPSAPMIDDAAARAT